MKFIKWIIVSVLCCFIITGCKTRSFTIATWNIGHFSNGVQPSSTIDIAKTPNIKGKYYDFINDSINADVFVINEYNDVFYKDKNGKDIITDSVLFNKFKYKFIGPRWWKCNAIFSKYRIRNLDNDKEIVYYFTAHKALNVDVKVSKRNTYYLENIVEVRGRRIKIVTVDIDFSKKVSAVYQHAQMNELIEKYKDETQIIICGDFNAGSYRLFLNAGYSVANDGSLKTFPSKRYPLDNIVYKGVDVSDVRMYPTILSDHNPLSCRITF